jgi:hypothetical protein
MILYHIAEAVELLSKTKLIVGNTEKETTLPTAGKEEAISTKDKEGVSVCHFFLVVYHP